MKIKEPYTIPGLITKLKDHNMIIEDETLAEKVLIEFNYYRFSGYALQFRDPKSEDDYIKGTSF